MPRLNYLRFFLPYFCVFIPLASFGEDVCSKYRFDTDVNVKNTTKYNPIIKSSDKDLVGETGHIYYQTSYSSAILVVPVPVKNGYCVSLRSFDVEINVPDFTIVIDKRLKPNTCAYNITLAHEKDHMNVNKTVINENLNNIKKAIIDATKEINPVFISDINEVEKIQLSIGEKIKSHKSVQDIKNKIESEMNDKNEKIDTRGDSFEMWKCEDFYKEMKQNNGKITID